MASLRVVFETLGCQDVATYVNSGNIVFSSTLSVSAATIETALVKAFGFDISALVVTGAHMQAIARAIPSSWKNDLMHKSDVIYLFPDIDKPSILQSVSPDPDVETIQYVPGALIATIERGKQSRSSLLKLMGTALYQRVTIRNVNTARKLAALCG